MELIPAGEFEMGSPDSESFSDEHPARTVFVDALLYRTSPR